MFALPCENTMVPSNIWIRISPMFLCVCNGTKIKEFTCYLIYFTCLTVLRRSPNLLISIQLHSLGGQHQSTAIEKPRHNLTTIDIVLRNAICCQPEVADDVISGRTKTLEGNVTQHWKLQPTGSSWWHHVRWECWHRPVLHLCKFMAC